MPPLVNLFCYFCFHSVSFAIQQKFFSLWKYELYVKIKFMTTIFKKEFADARKAYISAEFGNLNTMQREAVLATEGPLLILAGAGSGKTTVLINRIANILKYGKGSDSVDLPENADENMLKALKAKTPEAAKFAALDPVEPWRILAITFTNKAADELKARLQNMLGSAGDDIWACTFHSACVRILRRDAEKIGFSSSFSIYDTSDSLSLIKRILKDMNLDDKTFKPRSVLNAISAAKDAQIGPAEFSKNADATFDMRKKKIAEIYTEYMRRLFSADAMDFDDLISFTVKLLQEHDDVRIYWQKRFRYVLIDEYQDTNHLQYLLASILAGGSGNICVVGDDDQSIYKFRGATIENILSFESEYKNCRTIRLEQNYRSTEHILNAANAVIRNNNGRKGKELWTNNGTGDKLKLYVADNENEEAQYIASTIMSSYGEGANFRDHAVLYRMNAQSSQLEFAFKRAGIPYRVIGGNRFFDRAEIKDVLSYLNLIAAPSDDLRLLRIINSPPRGIGAKSIDTLSAIAARENQSLFEIADTADKYPELQRPAIKLRQFANMIKELMSFSETHRPDELFDELLNKSGYLNMLELSDDEKDKDRAENVKELKTSIIEYIKTSGDMSLEGYLANVALYTDMDNYDKDADCVVMMTMHSAKGLEFPTVFISGMEEGIFPGTKVIGEPDEMEEERRLCYVALTRAKQRLFLVCARQRMFFGRTTANKVSRFVEEIPEDDIEKNIPMGYSYSDKSYNTPWDYTPPERRVNYGSVPAFEKKAKTVSYDFNTGDNIKHKAFGQGVITKMTPMGGDFLIEINFEDIGNKKLMLRAAAPHMTKALNGHQI